MSRVMSVIGLAMVLSGCSSTFSYDIKVVDGVSYLPCKDAVNMLSINGNGSKWLYDKCNEEEIRAKFNSNNMVREGEKQ